MKRRDCPDYASEADLVAAWLAELTRFKHDKDWTIYPETAGWDLLLVHKEHGYQLGIEAKLSLNAKVLAQAIDGSNSYWRSQGPDYRSVLVPLSKCQHHMNVIAGALGLGVIAFAPADRYVSYKGSILPDESFHSRGWPNWLPAERCKLPDYVPDVTAGIKSPVQLTDWKVKAIKLMIVLERRGFVTRADMRAIQISPTRWCDSWQGFLDRGRDGYVKGKQTPDLRAQHPVNYAQIEADAPIWLKQHGISVEKPASLV